MDLLEQYIKGKLKRNKLHSGSFHIEKNVHIPLSILMGEKEGKKCFISAGVQGDEINGITLVQRMYHSLSPEKITGDIIFLPVVNTSGFHQKTRYVPEDKKDLNRAFGRGTTKSNIIAKAIFDRIVKISDFGIDCHDSGQEDVLIPHSRIHVDQQGVCSDGCTLEYGKLFGTKIMLQREGSRGMLAIEAFKQLNKPVLTTEVGGGLVLFKEYLKIGEQGIKNILIHHGMLRGKIILPKEQYVITDENRLQYNANLEGILHKNVVLGQDLHKGDLIASIHNPLTEETEEIRSEHCGFVFSLKIQDKINKGENITSILQTQACSVHKSEVHEGFMKIKNK